MTDDTGMPEPCQPIGCDNGYHLPGCRYIVIDDPAPVTDAGVAYGLALAEYVVRGGNPDRVMARCPVCEQTNVGPGHRTPLGYDCSFGRAR